MPSPTEVIASARNAFESGITKSLEFRINQLESLLRMYEDHTEAIVTAIDKDLRRGRQETIIADVDVLMNDVRNILQNLRSWAKPEKPKKQIINIMDTVVIESEPYGVVLIIGPWNYPFQLTFVPFSGAIAAGNCVVLKPSELAPASSKLIAELVPQYLDNDCYKVIEGGVPETTEILAQRFDYIFFTGSTPTGKIVQAAAAKYLTPTTLELGGKSPVYIDNTVDVDIVANRLLWGKVFNAGQTCVSPDYVLCSKEVQRKLVASAKKVLASWYGDNVQNSPDFARIINDNHFKRLLRLLDSGTVAHGGKSDASERFLEPTLLVDVTETSSVMQEEIFGPILPIFNIETTRDAINFINAREKPLALYIFSKNQATIDLLLKNTSSGGVTVNDTLMHVTCHGLPFGGVGNSGKGAYHGKYSFDTFSHKKPILIKKLSKLGERLQGSRYPPYSEKKTKFLTNMTRKLPGNGPNYWCYLFVFGLGVGSTFLAKYLCHYFENKQ